MKSLLEKAIYLAVEKHGGQVRKGSGIAYITHPLGVMAELIASGVSDEETLAAAVCHDLLEDTDLTYWNLRVILGERVADIVRELSDDKSLSKHDRKETQVRRAPYFSEAAARIKLADKVCNCRDILNSATAPNWKTETKLGYLESASRVVLALPDFDGLPELAIEFADMVRAGAVALRA